MKNLISILTSPVIAVCIMLSAMSCSPRDRYVTFTGYAQGGTYTVKINMNGTDGMVKKKPEEIKQNIYSKTAIHRFATVDEGVKAALDAKADIVVLCSSDDEYAEYAIPAYRAIGDKAIFIVAGAPACTEELQAAGIVNFINVKSNVLETLKALNAKLGI